MQTELDNIANELARREALKAGRTFGETEITKMKEYFVSNATSATPKSCIACMNEALRLLLNDPQQKVGSEVEKAMAKLQASGHAGMRARRGLSNSMTKKGVLRREPSIRILSTKAFGMR